MVDLPVVDILRLRHSASRLSILTVVLALILTGCSSGSSSEPVAWHIDPTPTLPIPTATASAVPPTPEATATIAPTATGARSGSPHHAGQLLTADKLKSLAPNELGVVPVLEYHVITTDPTQEAQFVRTKDDFIADLTWLYDHNFYIITMRELIENRISAPAGKNPVVLTFDDATSFQFSATKGADGKLVIDPDSAVGILEDFFASHPGFGHTALFAFIVNNCFAFPDDSQMDICGDKLTWLAEHGYEIGNHTMNHMDLLDQDDETFMHEVGQAKIFIDQHVPGPANLSDVLILPFGNYPDKDEHPDQRAMLRNGFEYKGETIKIRAAMMVGSNPVVSPASVSWDPIWIPRVQAFDESLAYWFDVFTSGGTVLYVSDGNPATITIPDPLPGYLPDQLDPDTIAAWGCELVQYNPDSGKVTFDSVSHAQGDDRGDLG
jgi:peptidoglycan/xylan/chitin deacetylase (PgdA/CDA1 family)